MIGKPRNPFLDLAKCDQCTLKGKRCLTVAPPTEQRDIVVVSQQPIAADVVANDAFDSRGGRLVRRLLEHIGISKDQWTGTYTVLCVPPDNMTATTSQQIACRDRLIAQVRSVKPKIVIAMGETSIRGLARTKAGSRIHRGKPQWSAELQAYILPTHHPRFAMEQPSAFFELAADFKKIDEILTWPPGGTVVEPKVKYHVINDEDKAIEAIKYMRQFDVIASDIETKGFNWKKDLIICAGFAWKEGLVIIFDKNIMNSEKVRPYLKEWFEDPNVTWVWQNGKFDIKFFRYQHGIEARVDYDTMLAHYCLNERRGTHDLEQLAVEFLYAEPYEYKLDKYKKAPGFQDYEDIPKPVLHEYLAKDVDYTFRLRLVFMQMFAKERATGRRIDFLFEQLLIPGIESFVNIEMNGLPTDRDYVTELHDYFDPLIKEHIQTLREYADHLGWDPVAYATWWSNIAMEKYKKEGKKKDKKPPNPTKPPKDGLFNPNSHQQLKYVMYELMKLPLYKKEMTSNKDARKYYMENYSDKFDVPFIERLDRLKKDSKAYSTYVVGLDKLVWDDNKIHATFNLHGTECVSGDTLIWTDKGLQYAEEVCTGSAGFTEAQIGVLSMEGPRQISHTYIGTERSTRHLNLGFGLELRCTPEHPIYTLTGWKESKDIAAGEYVRTSFGQQYFPDSGPISRDLATLIGMYLSDGHIRWNPESGHYFVSFSNQDPYIRALIQELCADLYDTVPMYDASTGSSKLYGKETVRAWLDMFPANGANNKRIPSIIRRGNKEAMLGFVEGCSLDSTWSLSSTGKGKPKKALIRFNSLDKERLQVIQQILWNMGVLSSLIEVKYNTKSSKHRTGESATDKQYQLNITGQQTQEYLRHFRPMTMRQHELAEQFNILEYTRKGFKNYAIKDGALYVKVQSNIESGLIEAVYDFTVPEVHNFTANGLIVHNTGRLSCSDPNLMNIPRDSKIKNIFVADDDDEFTGEFGEWVILQTDYSQAELRVLAVLGGSPWLQQVYYDDRDLHDAVSLEMYGPNFTKEQRVRAKAVNFGIPLSQIA